MPAATPFLVPLPRVTGFAVARGSHPKKGRRELVAAVPSPGVAGRIEAHSGGLIAKEKIMSSKPTHTAYLVSEPKEGSDRKPVWHEVGAVWPHKNGEGFDLVLPPGLSVSGRIVCTKPKPRGPQPS